MNRKVKHNLTRKDQGKIKTDGYRAENVDFFHRWKLQERKVYICLHWFVCPPDNVLLCKAML